jgi:hypothetical protein
VTHGDATIIAILAGKPAADLHARLSERLRAIASRRETPGLRAEAEAGYATRWWHIRILAVRCFGCWGGDANKAWLKERAVRPLPGRRELIAKPRDKTLHWSSHETLAARRAIAPLVEPADAGWVLDAWFGERLLSRSRANSPWSTFEYWSGAHSFNDAIGRLPPEAVMRRIDAAAASSDPAMRMAALQLAWSQWAQPDRMRVFQALAADAEPDVARMAGEFLRVQAVLAAREAASPSATPSTAPPPRNRGGRAAGSRLSAYRRSGAER